MEAVTSASPPPPLREEEDEELKLKFDVDSTRILHEVDPRFLSVALGSKLIAQKWSTFDFSNRRLLNLAVGLTPSYLRLGGTSADLILFREKPIYEPSLLRHPNEIPEYDYDYADDYLAEEEEMYFKPHNNKTIIMTGIDWMLINEFSYRVGWNFLFDINVLLRTQDDNDSWNSTNFQSLLDFSSKVRFANISWELGNEPNHLGTSLGHKLTG